VPQKYQIDRKSNQGLQFAVVVLYFTTSPYYQNGKQQVEMTMMRISRYSMSRVPNGLAIAAAALLLGSTIAGVGDSRFEERAGWTGAAKTAVVESRQARSPAKVSVPEKKNKAFKMSLFLFR